MNILLDTSVYNTALGKVFFVSQKIYDETCV